MTALKGTDKLRNVDTTIGLNFHSILLVDPSKQLANGGSQGLWTQAWAWTYTRTTLNVGKLSRLFIKLNFVNYFDWRVSFVQYKQMNIWSFNIGYFVCFIDSDY